jgi:hypothetical protein
MELLPEYVAEYKKQMGKGAIQKAYQSLMEYILGLRTHFSQKFPALAPGNVYQGYLDMTYFPLFPTESTARKLKIALVFIHKTVKFEVWLTARNKQIQARYWQLFRRSNWPEYRIPANLKGVDSIIEYTLTDNPDFGDLPALTGRIEQGTLGFIRDIESFLLEHPE